MQPRVSAALSLRSCMAALGRRRLASASSTDRTADPDLHSGGSDVEPAVFSGEPEDTKNVAEPKPATEDREDLHRPSRETDAFAHQKSSPFPSSPRLESVGVNQPLEPNVQQKKRNTTSAASLEDVSCAGLDGSPWPNDKERRDEEGSGRGRGRREDEERDVEFFKHHKASPLSEVEFADTRKPISRATDGTADSSYYGGGPDVVGWLPEQLETAEETLLRAARIWKETAMRGIPDSPQSRVLRALRGEK